MKENAVSTVFRLVCNDYTILKTSKLRFSPILLFVFSHGASCGMQALFHE